MPHEITWYLPHKVIDLRIWGHVTNEETDLHNDIIVSMLSEAQAAAPTEMLYIVYAALEVQSFPPLYLRFSQGLRVLRFKNRGTMFLVAKDGAIRSILEVTARVSREHFPLRVFGERQHAIEALQVYLTRDAQRTSSG